MVMASTLDLFTPGGFRFRSDCSRVANSCTTGLAMITVFYFNGLSVVNVG